MQVKSIVPDCVLIFMTTPNINILKERLIGRNTESMEVIEQRLNTALAEVDYINCYDYLIINDDVDIAVRDLKDAIKNAKAKVAKNNNFIKYFKGEI